MVRVTRSKKVYIPEDSTATDQPLKHKLISSNTLADISPSRGNSLLVRSVDSRSAKTKADNESSKKCLNGRSGTLQRSKPQDELNSTVDSAQTGVKINLDVSPKEGPKRLSQPLTHSEDIIPEYVPQCTEYFTDTDGTGVEKSSTSIKTTPNYCQLRIHEAENWANRNDLDSLKYQDTTNEESVLESEEDSFIQQITSRSPAKPVPRVDDPVEALDKIEEALEALDEVAKVELLVKRIKHPNRQSPKANNVSSASPQKGFNSMRRSKTMNPTVSSRNFSEPIGLSHRASRTSVTGPNLSRATILSKVADSPSSITTPVISQHTQRRSTIQPTSANPIKPTKPLTRPNFELPGEAVARKLKQQRENRIALRQSCHHEYQAAASNPKSSFPTGKPRNLKTRPSKNQVITSSKNQVSPKTGMRTPEVPDLRAKGFTNLSIHRSFTATPAVSHVNRDSANSEKSSNLSAMGTSSNASSQRPPRIYPTRPNCAAPTAPNSTSDKPKLPAKGPQISNTEISSLQPTNGSVNNLALPLSKSKEPELSNPSKSIKELSNASASNARNEAAERGRQAILKWAEEQMMKR